MQVLTRRTALKNMALTGAGFFLLPDGLWARSSAPKKLGIALVGLGYYSTDLLAPALQKTANCYLAGIVTGTPAKAEKWQEQYNIPDKNIYNYQNFDQIANNPDIDVVYVVLPPSMHEEYVIRAANAGKHVWCEKPMAMTEQECSNMIAACKKNKRNLAIGYRLHHEPTTKAWRQIIQQQKLGKVQTIENSAAYRDNRTNHWKQIRELGGGALLDMGVYAIQGTRMAANAEPKAVLSATTSTTRPEIYTNGLEETAIAKLEFPGGIFADIKTSFGENSNFNYIQCEKGRLEIAPFSGYANLKAKSPLGEIFNAYRIPQQQINQMDNEALRIMNRQSALVPGEEGQRDIRIVEAIKKAAKTGKMIGL